MLHRPATYEWSVVRFFFFSRYFRAFLGRFCFLRLFAQECRLDARPYNVVYTGPLMHNQVPLGWRVVIALLNAVHTQCA